VIDIATRDKKAKAIDQLQDTFTRCQIGILTDYRGLTAPQLTALRRRLREASIEYKVVKNTLARFAGERAGRSGLSSLFEGPVAIAFGYSNITEPARVLTDYIRSSQLTLSIKGGFISDRLLTAAEVTTLATLPPREVLLARVLGGMQSPISALVGCLSNPLRGLVGVLGARIKQLEGG